MHFLFVFLKQTLMYICFFSPVDLRVEKNIALEGFVAPPLEICFVSMLHHTKALLFCQVEIYQFACSATTEAYFRCAVYHLKPQWME